MSTVTQKSIDPHRSAKMSGKKRTDIVSISVTEAENLKMMGLAASRRMALATLENDRRRARVATEKDPVFLAACEKAGVRPTRRQAGKFAAGRGIAFRAAALIRVEKSHAQV